MVPPLPEPSALSPAARHALIVEAARRSRICWLSYPYDEQVAVRDRLVWHVWHEEAVVVLSLPRVDGTVEQVLPGLERARTVEVTMRSRDTGGLLVTWTGSVDVVAPGSERWEGHAAALLGVRLNLPDPAAARRAWAERGTVVRLAPPLP